MIDETLLRKLYPKASQQYVNSLETMPTPSPAFITSNDIANKYVTRYFIRVVNDASYVVEVDRRQFEEYKRNPRFLTTSIRWKIVGVKETATVPSGAVINGVADTNRQSVLNADLTFGGLKYYITDYLQYWQSEV